MNFEFFLLRLFFITYSLTCIINPGIITPEYYLENYNADKTIIKNSIKVFFFYTKIIYHIIK